MRYISTKRYGHERGYSIAYRQWRADSHCKLIHGYSLAFDLEFEANSLDARNWVVDFGSLKSFKHFLDAHFDHTLLVATDDPQKQEFERLHQLGLCKLVEVERTGCEGLAEFLFNYLNEIWLPENYPQSEQQSIKCRKVRVWETPDNSAMVEL